MGWVAVAKPANHRVRIRAVNADGAESVTEPSVDAFLFTQVSVWTVCHTVGLPVYIVVDSVVALWKVGGKCVAHLSVWRRRFSVVWRLLVIDCVLLL